MTRPIATSIVIPAFNERGNILPLYREIKTVMDRLGSTYEVLWIDDGSTDETFDTLRELSASDPAVSVIRLRRNFGQTAALAAGFRWARGQVVVTMDADGQNDPRDIPALLEKIEEGYDIVSGWRKHRLDPYWTRVLPSKVANRLIAKVTGVRLNDFGCSLKAYQADIVKKIDLYGELHRFIPAIASWRGIQLTEVVVRHHTRNHGKSNYSLDRAIKVFLDLITVRFIVGFSTRPVHWFGTTGLMTSTLGLAFLVYILGRSFLHGQSIVDRPLFILAVVLMMMGVQMIMLGLLAEVQVRTYHEAQDKMIFVVQEILEGSGSVPAGQSATTDSDGIDPGSDARAAPVATLIEIDGDGDLAVLGPTLDGEVGEAPEREGTTAEAPATAAELSDGQVGEAPATAAELSDGQVGEAPEREGTTAEAPATAASEPELPGLSADDRAGIPPSAGGEQETNTPGDGAPSAATAEEVLVSDSVDLPPPGVKQDAGGEADGGNGSAAPGPILETKGSGPKAGANGKGPQRKKKRKGRKKRRKARNGERKVTSP